MLILYKMPNMGWDVTRYLEPGNLPDFHLYGQKGHTFTVATVDEFYYIQSLALLLGKTIPVEYDPGFTLRRHNVTQLRTLDLD